MCSTWYANDEDNIEKWLKESYWKEQTTGKVFVWAKKRCKKKERGEWCKNGGETHEKQENFAYIQ